MKAQSTLITLSLFAVAALGNPASGKDLETDVAEKRQPFHEETLGKRGIQYPSAVLVFENSDKRLPTSLTSSQYKEGKRQNKELPSPKTDPRDPKKDKQETELRRMKILAPALIFAGVCGGLFGFDEGLAGGFLGAIIGGMVGAGLGMIRAIDDQERHESRK